MRSISFRNRIILILISLNRAIKIFNNFITIQEAGPRQTNRILYKYPFRRNLLFFFPFLCRGVPNYASFESTFTIKTFSWRRSFMRYTPSILKCSEDTKLFECLKFTTSWFPPSCFKTKSILLKNSHLCWLQLINRCYFL